MSALGVDETHENKFAPGETLLKVTKYCKFPGSSFLQSLGEYLVLLVARVASPGSGVLQSLNERYSTFVKKLSSPGSRSSEDSILVMKFESVS